MNYGKIAFAIVSIFFVAPALNARASELDAPAVVPHGLIVRVNAQGVRELFKADVQAQVVDAPAAEAATASFVSEANRIAHVNAGTELDRTASSEAWCYWYAPNYYSSYTFTYSYSWYNTTWSYYPTYNWNAYGYNYYYYYWR